MAPTLNSLRNLIYPRTYSPETVNLGGSPAGPLAEARVISKLVSRDEYSGHHQPDPASGVLDPHDISNVGFFVLFALIGVAFVATGIWFFFWAKNGGFHFKETDWDDYKTTVLRRRGPNGTLLSGATESTKLGGGSVYKDVADRDHDDDGTVITESTAMSGITAGPSDIGARQKRMKKQDMREKEREKRRRERGEKRESKRHVGEAGVEDEDAEREAKKELRSYRHEKPARVGGLNKESEGSTWDGSTNPTESNVSSNLLSNRQSTPTNSPAKEPRSGIRKVYSTAERIEAERLRKDARSRRRAEQERGQSASPTKNTTSRRDFSYQRSVVGSESALTESLLEGSAVGGKSEMTEESGTKSYYHPRPELRAARAAEREERRARRGGYRRGRGEDDEEL